MSTTVAELIRRLQEHPDDAEVTVRSGDASWAALLCEGEEVLQADDDSGWGR